MAIWFGRLFFGLLHTYVVRCQWCRHEMIGARFSADMARERAIDKEVAHYNTCTAVPAWDRKAKVDAGELPAMKDLSQ